MWSFIFVLFVRCAAQFSLCVFLPVPSHTFTTVFCVRLGACFEIYRCTTRTVECVMIWLSLLSSYYHQFEDRIPILDLEIGCSCVWHQLTPASSVSSLSAIKLCACVCVCFIVHTNWYFNFRFLELYFLCVLGQGILINLVWPNTPLQLHQHSTFSPFHTVL